VPFSTIISKINALQYGNSAKPGGGANIYIGVTSDVAGPEPTLSNFQNYNSTQPRAKIYGPATRRPTASRLPQWPSRMSRSGSN
jgi:hypothetical protein